jgi:hypothetical protein
VLQLANRPALQTLSQFISHPTLHNVSRLRVVCIPAIYDVLQFHQQRKERYPQCLVELCTWVLDRGRGALSGLIVYSAPPLDPNASQADDGWETVSGLDFGLDDP